MCLQLRGVCARTLFLELRLLRRLRRNGWRYLRRSLYLRLVATIHSHAVAIPVAHGELWCRVGGHGETSIVFLHGELMDSRQWLPQMDVLRGGYLVAAPDLRGHGRSAEARSAYDPADDVLAVARHVTRGRVALVGFGGGAGMALSAAVNAPETVSALVLAEPMMGRLVSEVLPNYDAIAAQGPEVALSDPGIAAAVAALQDEDNAAFAEACLRSGDLISVGHPASELVRSILVANARAVGRDQFAVSGPNLVERLHWLEGIPTLLVTSKDRKRPLVAETLRDHGLRLSERTLPTSAELINIELDDAFNAAIQSLLDEG
ncbi:MAG: alpha/beta fold hydrolase [Solirubrobacteraceae bacterium]